jgi:hypothetical protein
MQRDFKRLTGPFLLNNRRERSIVPYVVLTGFAMFAEIGLLLAAIFN